MAEQAVEWKTKGNAALSAGNFKEAIECYTKAIELDGSQHVFFSNRSAAYLSCDEADKALEDAEACVKIKPDWAKGYCRRGAAYHKLKKYPEAMASYEDGLKVDPSNAACQSGLEEVKAISASGSNPLGNLFGPGIEDRIRSNPRIAHLANDPSFMAILAQIQQNPNNINQYLQDQRVMTCLAELMGLNSAEMSAESPAPPKKEPTPAPKEPEPMQVDLSDDEKKAQDAKQRGNAHYKKREFEKAIECYNEAIGFDPSNISFYTNRAAVKFELKQYDDCIKDCVEAIKVGRENRADYALIAKAYVRMGNANLKKGDEFLEAAIEAFENAQVENRTREAEQKIKKAQLDLKKAKAKAYIDPAKGLEAKEKGNERFKAGDFPGAVEFYSEAIKRDPESPVYYANRAAAYTKLTCFNEAKADCDKSLALDPKYVKAWSRLAAIQCFMKEFHKAMESYQKGIDIDPENVDCKEGLQRVVGIIQQNQSGEVDKERAAHAMADPEIQAILRDPIMQNVLQDFQTDPRSAQRHMQNAGIMAKIEKLIAAGVLQTR